jgi:glycosyltransferase involved in cell wall biosynthesis
MAVGLPIVSFDLREARVSAGDAARYVECNDTDAFAAAASALLDDPTERRRRGRIGQNRVAGALNWEHSKVQLLASYAAAMNGSSPEPAAELPARQGRVPVRL